MKHKLYLKAALLAIWALFWAYSTQADSDDCDSGTYDFTFYCEFIDPEDLYCGGDEDGGRNDYWWNGIWYNNWNSWLGGFGWRADWLYWYLVNGYVEGPGVVGPCTPGEDQAGCAGSFTGYLHPRL